MKKLICSLRDKQAELYMAPVCVPTIGALYRDLKDAARPGQDNPISKYPGDFDVYQLATFDDETGVLDVLSPPHRLTSCDVFALSVAPAVAEPQQAHFVDLREAESRN